MLGGSAWAKPKSQVTYQTRDICPWFLDVGARMHLRDSPAATFPFTVGMDEWELRTREDLVT